MSNQLTSNAEALRLFFTEDVYLLKQEIDAVEQSVVAKVETPQVVSKSEPVNLEPASTLPPLLSVPKVETKTFAFEYLGKNQKGILILVNDSNNKVSTPQGTELLRKLVKAIELTNSDFALVNYAGYPESNFQDFHSFFNFKIVLSFGVTPQQLGLEDLAPNVLHPHQVAKLIFTKNLHDLDSDTASKKVLWGSLQQLK